LSTVVYGAVPVAVEHEEGVVGTCSSPGQLLWRAVALDVEAHSASRIGQVESIAKDIYEYWTVAATAVAAWITGSGFATSAAKIHATATTATATGNAAISLILLNTADCVTITLLRVHRQVGGNVVWPAKRIHYALERTLANLVKSGKAPSCDQFRAA